MTTAQKIHIFYTIKETPWGGGNQFLKALRHSLRARGVYSETVGGADVVLFNSHTYLVKALWLRLLFPRKTFIHRIDGPISQYRGGQEWIDLSIALVNNAIMDGTVFQSQWCLAQQPLVSVNMPKTVIWNAPDPAVFYPASKTFDPRSQKTRLISTAWSSNMKKGFSVLQYLDQHLDFSRFEMTHIGNSPFQFNHIRQVAPVSSSEVADYLRSADIFVFSSELEACSNSLLEALHCGLPCLVKKGSSNTEVLGRGGELFDTEAETLPLLDRICESYDGYRAAISVPSIEQVSAMYVAFASQATPTRRLAIWKLIYFLIKISWLRGMRKGRL